MVLPGHSLTVSLSSYQADERHILSKRDMEAYTIIVRSMALVLRNGGQQLLSGFYFPYPYESVTIHMEDRE